MRLRSDILRFGLAASIALAAAAPATATTVFNFQFNSRQIFVPDDVLTPPIVGTGTLTSPIDLTAGTYDLSTLAGFELTFSFLDGNSYTSADISTPLSGVAVLVTDVGGGIERLVFIETGRAGSDGGPHSGVLDLDNGSNFLSFAPSILGTYLYQETGSSRPIRGSKCPCCAGAVHVDTYDLGLRLDWPFDTPAKISFGWAEPEAAGSCSSCAVRGVRLELSTQADTSGQICKPGSFR